jgi:hypothetical protein
MLNEGVSSRPVRKIVLMGCAPDADMAASHQQEANPPACQLRHSSRAVVHQPFTPPARRHLVRLSFVAPPLATVLHRCATGVRSSTLVLRSTVRRSRRIHHCQPYRIPDAPGINASSSVCFCASVNEPVRSDSALRMARIASRREFSLVSRAASLCSRLCPDAIPVGAERMRATASCTAVAKRSHGACCSGFNCNWSCR